MGWYGTILSIAKTGFWTFGGHNAYDSVMLSKLHDVFYYLSAETANNTYLQNLQAEQQKGK